MKQREFIASLGAAGAYGTVPRVARAQQDTRMRRVAMLGPQYENQPQTEANGVIFRNELARLGWVEGRNLQFDVRYGRGDVDRMRANAAELVGLAPDVIVTSAPTGVRIAQQQTKTIPIVFAMAGDVFALGLVANLAHPEGNTTGVTNAFVSVGSKLVELLKEAIPRVERVGYVYNPEFFQPTPSASQVSRVLGIRMIDIPFRNSVDLERGINAFAAEPNGGLVIFSGATAPSVYRTTIYSLTTQYRLPTIYPIRGGFEGGLIFYGARETDIMVRTASFVDRILRGAKPGDLPVEFPSRFELAVNLKIAKAIGVTIPEAFLAQADEVIE
jgi:putative tryptophan/tyrosine transport system substrate-binding protein